MRNIKIICLVIATCLFFTSCATFIPKVNAPATGEEKPQTYENPILTMKMWVPLDKEEIEGFSRESYNLLGREDRDFSDAFREIELLPDNLVVITADYENYDEYDNVFFRMANLFFQAEYQGPMEITAKKYEALESLPCIFDCEVEGMELLSMSDWPISYIGGANKLSFTLQTYNVQNALWYNNNRLDEYKQCGQFTKQYLNDLLDTPNIVYEGVWRVKVENVANVVCSDLLTGSVQAKATIRIYWYTEWYCQNSPWFDSSSSFYGEEYGKEKQLCEDIEGMGIEYYPHYTIELTDYWQVVEEE